MKRETQTMKVRVGSPGLEQVQVADLTGRDIGRRVVVTNDGVAVEGVLDTIWFNRTYKGEPQCTSVKVTADKFGTFEIDRPPLDYSIEIERDDVEFPTDPTEEGPFHE
ncbi:hypothetical protein [Agromyces sp. SYSU T00194]|uniref:hypothetical protein n=1 Tax=Agromyces chitinivorans TaxID=3158560 RepID=UPI0033961325